MIKRVLGVTFVIVGLSFVTATPTHAIIFLPALILIPIAKLVALIVGLFSVPSLGIGVMWHKLFKSSWSKILAVIILSLILIAIFVGVFIHFQNPGRPLL